MSTYGTEGVPTWVLEDWGLSRESRHFFKANEIAESKQVAVFLGAQTFSLLRDLLAPKKPQEQTMAVLKETLEKHYEPKPLVIAKRFHFYRRNQGTTETVSEYVAQLRHLATLRRVPERRSEGLPGLWTEEHSGAEALTPGGEVDAGKGHRNRSWNGSCREKCKDLPRQGRCISVKSGEPQRKPTKPSELGNTVLSMWRQPYCQLVPIQFITSFRRETTWPECAEVARPPARSLEFTKPIKKKKNFTCIAWEEDLAV